ncbi:MAG: 23S rRNA (pseudouridine(1915)-N(3))-methyltransferase RlmH [Clostridia bacterium]|nr:23S rRNA (pseudouridine(1915)-N(3))-methyltransferase RlmH [Clostridia bacterium]
MMPTLVRFITVGTLKEPYLRAAAEEYRKRLSGMCRVEEVELKEVRLPDDPSQGEIDRALEAEAKAILEAIPPRAYTVALCVEGKQFSSPELSKRLEAVSETTGSLCFIIGSSHGLAPRVKDAARLRLSVSELTFPHQLMRVILYEAVYRIYQIAKGTRYHK